jgi:AhpD family alkylhydroperoxidase
MSQRLPWVKVAPGAYTAMSGMEQYAAANVEPALYELVKLRASFINGCAYCIDMHTHDAMKNGESVQRLFLVAAWHEAPEHFTERERAAFALTDAITKIGEHGVPEEVWAQAAGQFEEKELADLITAIVTINAWNRFAVSTRMTVPKRA